jgi:hemerythrin-like metal-binding protein
MDLPGKQDQAHGGEDTSPFAKESAILRAMVNIDIVPWDDHFAIGLPEVDALNRRLVDLINRLAAHVALGLDKVELDIIFDELLAHADHHFNTEEAIWDGYLAGDAELESHLEGHGAFFATLFCLNAELATRSQTETAEGSLDYLVLWLVSHILEADRHSAGIVLGLQTGLSLEDAKMQATQRISDTNQTIYTASARNTLHSMREIARSQQVKT